jgi:hypothetical protein
MPKSVAGIFPSPLQLTHTIQRLRKVSSAAPSNPESLEDLVIPASYQKSIANEDFLLFDSGSANDRILLFSTQENLRALHQSDHWYADGTFKCAPSLFTQLFSIHGVISGSTHPLVHGLLPNKREATYTRFLTALNELGSNAQLQFQPKSILTDFEKSSLNSFEEVFPTAEKRGCYFHHAQAIWRHIQQLPDVLEKYKDKTSPDFGLNLRCLAALAFVPTTAVVDSFEALLQIPFFVQNELLLQSLIDYYEDTWIGRPIRGGGRRDPLFPHSLEFFYKIRKKEEKQEETKEQAA